MTRRKSRVKLPPREIMRGKQYPGVRGKVVDWVDHAFEDNVRMTAVKSAPSTSKSLPATTGPKGLARRPRPDFISSLGNRTTPSCGEFSIPMKSPRGSSPCENPSHPHGSPPRFRLHAGGSSLSLPCGYAFRLLHLSAVCAVCRDKTRQTQRRIRSKSSPEQAR